MAKVTKVDRPERTTVQAKTKDKVTGRSQSFQWWKANSQKELVEQLLSTAEFLKNNQSYRQTQASLYSRLYGNQPITGTYGQNSKLTQNKSTQLPIDRPTMNVIQSCTDTLVSRITQSRPRPQFLTDNGDYKQRKLGQNLNHFMDGEFYRLKIHQMGEFIMRDACVLGDSYAKVFRRDGLVAVERVLATELYEDPSDAYYGDPRSRIQIKLVDRSVLADMFPEYKSTIQKAENGFVDNSSDAQSTTADQVLVVEGWHLPSGKEAGDGRHAIVCSAGVIEDRDWTKQTFPFAKLSYSPRLVGTVSQGLVEQLMGTQMEINRILITISKSINIMGVPRIFLEDGSKVVKAHFNNEIGSIITFRGTMPHIEPGNSGIAADVYAQLQRLIEQAYQQSGISALSAASQKPAGLDSGKALREYDDIQTDRFAAVDRRYHNFFIDLSYLMIDEATEIVKDEGKYSTIYPNRDGTREIDLKAADLIDNPFVIQCFDESSLPRDPAGRKQSIVEDMQAGLISKDEGRRMLDYPDLEANEKLQNAAEERILQMLDAIVTEGKYTPPDPFMPFDLATTLTTQYYNLYVAAKLEPKREKMLRDFFVQIQALKQAANPPAPVGPSAPSAAGSGGMPGTPPPPGGTTPLAVPTSPPVSDMLPNAPGAA